MVEKTANKSVNNFDKCRLEFLFTSHQHFLHTALVEQMLQILPF